MFSVKRIVPNILIGVCFPSFLSTMKFYPFIGTTPSDRELNSLQSAIEKTNKKNFEEENLFLEYQFQCITQHFSPISCRIKFFPCIGTGLSDRELNYLQVAVEEIDRKNFEGEILSLQYPFQCNTHINARVSHRRKYVNAMHKLKREK